MNAIDEISNGAWARLRNLLGALDRVDRLETSSEFDGWLQAFARDEAALAATLREFLLRALRLASDPLNFQILSHLKRGGPTSFGDLLTLTRVSRVELVERANELARAGLTLQALEGEQVEITNLALGLLTLWDDILAQMKTLATNDYLLNPKAPLPQPPQDHSRNINLTSKI
jgi:hypothetical protein